MEIYFNQIDTLIKEYGGLRSEAENDELRGVADVAIAKFNTRAMALIFRICTPDSVYAKQVKKIFDYGGYPGFIAGRIISVVRALSDDVLAGFMQSQSELIHGELFENFLEMAEHLLVEGYKDAAAVIAGSSLESHLHNMATKVDIQIETESDGNVRRVSTNRLNQDLRKANIIKKLDEKSVLSWLDLRNKAAHGDYNEYEDGQVRLLISGVRDFIARHPA